MMEEKTLKTEAGGSLKYLAIHTTQIISGLIFLSVGIISVIFYDYGLLSFLFAIPQFFLTGLIPFLFGLLIILRNFLETERVSIDSNNDTLEIKASWIKSLRKKNLSINFKDIQYVQLKYRETKTKRWIIIILLVLFTIEVNYQNAIDLFGYARIAPILILFTILMFMGIILFTFFPKRFIAIGNGENEYLIQYKELSNNQLEKLLSILKISSSVKKRNKSLEILFSNILSHFSSFILSIFLIFLALLLMITPLYFGYFTRIVALTYGMKLLERTVNRSPYYFPSDEYNLYMGCSLRLTFIQTIEATHDSKITFSPLRFHLFEITCIFYLMSQVAKYGFRMIWWPEAGINPIYLLIGSSLLVLLFIKWFNPSCVRTVKFPEYSFKIMETEVRSFMEKPKRFLNNFRTLRSDKKLLLSLILFIGFFIGPMIYYLVGGNFVIL